MELLEETLRHRISGKPLEIETVIDLGIQIAAIASVLLESPFLKPGPNHRVLCDVEKSSPNSSLTLIGCWAISAS
jgi:hypothetical protein